MKKKIKREGERLIRETGIDFKRYRKPEMVENISDLIGFIGQTRAILLRRYMVLLCIITLLTAWFYTQDMHMIGVLLFFAVGVLFGAAAGTALGTMKLSEKAVKDSAGVVVLMLDFIKGVREDVATVESKTGSEISVSDLIRGSSYVVFIPLVNDVIRGKLKLFAWPAIFVAENVIFYFTKFLSAAVDKLSGEPSGEKKGEAKIEVKTDDRIDKAVDAAREKVEPLSDTVIRSVKIPMKILFTITLIIGLPILLVIYLIF